MGKKNNVHKFVNTFNPDISVMNTDCRDYLFDFHAGIGNENFNDFLKKEADEYRTNGNGVTYIIWNTTYDNEAKAIALNNRINEVFWDATTGICYDLPEHKRYSQLGNAIAILCGAVSGTDAERICELLLTDAEMTPVSLSMICFKYDAWLKVDKERFAPIILEDIEKTYTPMIEFGSTTVWETELGESDFDNAGSLCHGWSALPIYYYHILL